MHTAVDTADRRALAHAVLVAMEIEIERRRKDRRWYRESLVGRRWLDWRRENDGRLLTLLRVYNRARRMLRVLNLPPDPLDVAKATDYADYGYSAVLAQYQAEGR